MADVNPAASHTCSRTVTKTINGSHRYMVDGFSLLRGMGSGKRISSDVFTIAGYQWCLDFYPDGNRTEVNVQGSHVSVYLVLESRDTQVTALSDISLLDQSGNGDHFTKSHGPHLFHSKEGIRADWGYSTFFEREKLITSKYLKDDSLVLLCNINVVRTTKEPPKECSIFIPSANLGHCFKGILDTGMASDIVFKISNKAFKAHKLILAARSQVFQAQFYGPFSNPKTNEVDVKDISPGVFEAMLDFIYSDSLPNMDESRSSSSTTLAQHLLAAADRYGLDRLKLFCEAKLCEKLTVEMVTDTLGLADQHNCCHLKSACLKFIASNKNLGVLMNSDDFRKLEKSSPSLLLELLQTIADETRNHQDGGLRTQ